MTPDTKQDAKYALAITAALAALVTGGVIVSDKLVTAHPQPTMTLIWDKNDTDPNTTTEVWASTNLTTWTLRTNVSGTNRVTLSRDKQAEFFKIRNKLQIGTNAVFSDWARKTTR